MSKTSVRVGIIEEKQGIIMLFSVQDLGLSLGLRSGH